MAGESETLRRLEREARRESKRRERDSRRGRAARGESRRQRQRAATSGGAHEPFRVRHPGLRRVLIRGGIAVFAVVVVSVVWPPFLIPVDGPVTSRFFLRTVPESIFLFDVEHHRGIDFGAPTGTPVRSSRSGRVVSVWTSPTYGLVIDVRHPLGFVSRYAHLSGANVEPGDWVWRAHRIGSVGMTGRATGPHLHFEIRLRDRSLPPGFFLMFHQVRRTILRG